MGGIEGIKSKLNLLYGRCVILGEESCICKDYNNEYKLYGLVGGTAKLIDTYDDFFIINERVNGFRKNRDGLYGICDNVGKIIKNPLYNLIGASKGDLVIVSDLSNGLGVLNTSTKEYIMPCNYDEIALYDRLDFIVTSQNYFDMVEISDLSGSRILSNYFSKIYITDKIIVGVVCGIGNDITYVVYNLNLNRINDIEDRVTVGVYEDKLDVCIETSSNIIKYSNLNIVEPIKKKAGLGL